MPSLLDGFVESVQRYPKRPALYLDDQVWTYEQLATRAAHIAHAIVDTPRSEIPFAGVVASSSITAYAGIVATLMARKGFVPIDPDHPPQRIQNIVDHSGVDTLIVGTEGLDRLEGLLEKTATPLMIIAPQTDDLRGLSARYPRHRYRTGADLDRSSSLPDVPAADPDAPAYLVYTSGSTRCPRGVAVHHAHICAYLDAIDRRLPLRPDDRCSHTFPLTFDLSIHDLFSTWSAGAALCSWSPIDNPSPTRFIHRHRLTRWFSVPTVAMTMERLGELRPDTFPTLRHSLFCGEPLPVQLARHWAQAAPNSSVTNLYGPTETTVAIACQHFDDASPPRRGLVSLGHLFDGHQALVVDGDDQPVVGGQPGELLISGPQMTPGYWGDGEQRRQRFVHLEGYGDRKWFRTGDLVDVDTAGRLHFAGRIDDQIKLRGHHVELSEVDHALRRACGHCMAAAVGWPRDHAGVYGLVGLVATDKPLDRHRVLAHCRRYLPNPLVPDRVVGLSRLPTNERGKLDRNAMLQLLRTQEV